MARTAIIELLRVLERRWDSRRRSASIANDFQALAGWFAGAPGDEDAHRLFAAAFGLWPSRHAHIPAPTAKRPARRPLVCGCPRPRSPPPFGPPAAWPSAAGPAGSGTRPRLRALRQRAQAEELADHDDPARRPDDGRHGPVVVLRATRRQTAFSELLALLAVGLEGPLGTDGCRRALSGDGQVEVVLRDPGDGRTATITTGAGELRGPDLLVTITLGRRRRATYEEEIGA